MSKHIRYRMQGAYVEGKKSGHPQDVMESLGITYQHPELLEQS